MFRKISFVFLFIIFVSQVFFAQTNNFEGKIVYKITTDNSQESQKMVYLIKDKMTRMEVSQMPGYMLLKDSILTIVMPMQKMYMQTNAKQNSSVQTSPDEFLKNKKPVATGKKKVILGYNCSEYVVNEDDGKATVWGTEELTNFPGFDGSGKDAFAEAIGKKNFFPMLIEAEQEGMKMKMEVIEIKKEKLNSNLFKIPEGYNKVNVPGM